MRNPFNPLKEIAVLIYFLMLFAVLAFAALRIWKHKTRTSSVRYKIAEKYQTHLTRYRRPISIFGFYTIKIRIWLRDEEIRRGDTRDSGPSGTCFPPSWDDNQIADHTLANLRSGRSYFMSKEEAARAKKAPGESGERESRLAREREEEAKRRDAGPNTRAVA